MGTPDTSERADNPAEEAQLVEALRRGDETAYRRFYQQYSQRLYRHIYYQVDGDRQIAEDVLQETLLGAVRSLASFRGGSRLYTWLCAIAGHQIADHHRRRQRAQQRFVPQHALPDWYELIDYHPLPEEIVQRQETRQLIRDILYSLPPHYRQALLLHYVEGIPVDEVAAVMDRSVKSTESILHRARQAFRVAFARAQDREPAPPASGKKGEPQP